MVCFHIFPPSVCADAFLEEYYPVYRKSWMSAIELALQPF